ncbi:ubiquitin thioesterase OTU1 [Agrilus planipennis]|uniref:Ubiquitin thioesterase OTU n=1 Tax=Agrilus planipennis TaxID=224129 RepID=A0A1W4WR28_AGRPL|nr:ubiquitin thioesterase OTU1 [Agrilus planipennis]XP_018322485.1 ubiquitin thioesterase OTU1 [Agrilus planipennis]
MTSLILKVKTKTGQRVLKGLTSDSTIKELKQELSVISNIPVSRLIILSGYPPKKFDLSGDSKLLADSGLSSGEILIVEESQEPVQEVSTDPENENEECKEKLNNDLPGFLMKQIVPADNSCLFTSLNFVLSGILRDSSEVAPYMRQIVSHSVLSEPDTYSEAILGKPNDEYATWILNEKSWGGAIELSVLANYYGVEVAVVDTVNGIINRFGEDQKFPHRVFLMFDGIHYDPLYLETSQGEKIQTIFSADDERLLEEALQLGIEAKSSRQFTDVNKFMLKCLECNVFISGQAQAQQHAQSTGHTNFGEV